MDELDAAIASTKTRTAAGPDGISNAFIKKFWKQLRTPLLKYTRHSFDTGLLSPSFCTASLKLIPKKGDCTQIKNWQPISLLNCIYKIISKAVNNRLSTIIDRITSRAQKGFTPSRYIQEVLINVIENIAHCNAEHKNAVLIALDQSKAFDSIRHSFLVAAYKFFGIGDVFIKMLRTITENRTASIIFEDGSVSKQFQLQTGAPQGNSPSPVQYNIGEQILILKLIINK